MTSDDYDVISFNDGFNNFANDLINSIDELIDK